METKTKLIFSAVGAVVLSIAALAYAQTAVFAVSTEQQAAPQMAATTPATLAGETTCASQHQERPGVSTSDLLADSYEIKAAVPGGVWLQKKKDVFYCNSGITKDDETMCWKLRAPMKGQNCIDAQNRSRSKALPS